MKSYLMKLGTYAISAILAGEYLGAQKRRKDRAALIGGKEGA